MKLRSYLLPATLLLAIAVPAFAQQPPTPAPPQAPRAARAPGIEAALRLKSDLKLTDAQVAQLEALQKEIVAEREAMRKSAEQRRDRFQKILSDEQRTQLREKMHHQMWNQRINRGRMDRMPRGDRGVRRPPAFR